jgi:hypothetical protein
VLRQQKSGLRNRAARHQFQDSKLISVSDTRYNRVGRTIDAPKAAKLFTEINTPILGWES